MPDLRLRLGVDLLVVAGPLDGALMAAGVEDAECLAMLNVIDEELVLDTHRRFKLAGANAVLANTFSASAAALAAVGFEEHLEAVNRAGVRLARAAGFEHVIAVAAAEEQVEPLLAEAPDALLLQYDNNKLLLPEGDIVESIYGLSFEETLDALRQHTDTAPIFVAPDMTSRDEAGQEGDGPFVRAGQKVRPPLVRHQLRREQNQVSDELATFALEARALGAALIGTAAGSLPVYTGALYAAVGDTDVVYP